jgi:hypothetical protein
VVSVTDPYGRILGFLDRPQLSTLCYIPEDSTLHEILSFYEQECSIPYSSEITTGPRTEAVHYQKLSVHCAALTSELRYIYS